MKPVDRDCKIAFMDETASPFLNATINQVKVGWAERLQLPASTFNLSDISLVPKDGSKDLVVVQVQNSTVAVCPPALIPFLSPLSQIDLLDLEALLQILIDFQPNPIGIATIAYSDAATFCDSSISDNVRVARADEVVELLSSCTQGEQEESGIATMPHLFGAQSDDGKTRAIAGYEVWDSKIAQMGILTMPGHRGKGFGFSAALAAAQAALETGLIPQWRCRIGNESSYRLSQQLGFRELGRQLAIDLTL